MIAPVNVNRVRPPREVAREAWGELPDWVDAFVLEVERSNRSRAAARIGYSPSVATGILSRSYGGDLEAVEAKVRGALMGETVACRGYGMEIGRDQCLREQEMPNTGASAQRARVYAACRSGRCPHSRVRPVGEDA